MGVKKALVFDDNHICRAVLSDILADKNIEVTAFSDPTVFLAQHAKNYCQYDKPCVDVILTDNQMPGMTGLEFLEKLQQMNCKIPQDRKAVISGNWTSDQIQRAEHLNCVMFYKPVPIEIIHSWLED